MKNNNTFGEFCRLTNLAINQKYLAPVNREKLRKLTKKHIYDILSIERQNNCIKSEYKIIVDNYYLNLIKK